MMTDARRGAFNVLLVWSIDRFGRSMAGNVNDALALDDAGVKIASVREPWLDTGGPVRDLLLAIFSGSPSRSFAGSWRDVYKRQR